MSTKHTPEPWTTKVYEENETRLLGPVEEDGNRHWIGDIIGPLSNEANAKRIVECVNAMQGIDHPVELMSLLRGIKGEDVLKAVKERDELRSAFSEVADMLMKAKRHLNNIEPYFSSPKMIAQIDEVLTKHIP